MPFSICPYHRFPMHCSVTYHAGPFLKRQAVIAQCSNERRLLNSNTPLVSFPA